MADKLLKSITFPDLSDRYVIADPTLSVEGAGADAKATGDALATKANTDGSYESMTVGNAEQLVSNVRVNDKTPYLFRTSGGSVDIGDREYVNGIVGGTVAWNQFLGKIDKNISNNGITISVSASTGVVTVVVSNNVTGYAQMDWYDSLLTNGHVYLLYSDKPIANGMEFYFGGTDGVRGSYNSPKDQYTIAKATSVASHQYLFVGQTTAEGTYEYKLNIFDLTQMFGSTIADYIYSLEQATAGAGVAWFKKLFPKPYYAYNAGELKSVSGLVSHDTVGFNAWDEEWEVGAYNSSDGQKVTTSDRIRSKNYIRVVPNTAYYYKAPNGLQVYGYDADKSYIGMLGTSVKDKAITTPTNVHYITFNCAANSGTTYNHDICINLHWDGSRDGEYEPYELHSYPLDSDVVLRGIPKLDADNKLYYDGDIYEADGTVTRRYKAVTLNGAESGWGENARTDTYIAFTCTLNDAVNFDSNADNVQRVVSDRFVGKSSNQILNAGNAYDVAIISSKRLYFKMLLSEVSGTDAFKAWLAQHPTTLVYELATPTTETADPYTSPQIVNDFGTEEYVLDDSAFPVPVGHDTDYPVNLVAKLEMAPNSPSGSGDFIVRQTNGVNEYVPLVIEDALPTIPSATGSYVLTVTVADGVDPVLAWTQA